MSGHERKERAWSQLERLRSLEVRTLKQELSLAEARCLAEEQRYLEARKGWLRARGEAPKPLGPPASAAVFRAEQAYLSGREEDLRSQSQRVKEARQRWSDAERGAAALRAALRERKVDHHLAAGQLRTSEEAHARRREAGHDDEVADAWAAGKLRQP